MKILMLMVGLASAGDLFAQAPAQVNASYRIYKSGILIGTVEEQFTRDGDKYKIVSATQTAGPLAWVLRDRLTVTSSGRIAGSGLEPSLYEFARQKNQTKNIVARFDWSKNQIVSQHEGKTEIFDLPGGTLDRVSAMYQFMFKTPQSEEVSIWMSQGKRAEQYRYLKQGEATLQIGGTSYETVHYARETKPGESRAQLWLAKAQHYLPVRMVFEDSSGISLEQSLVQLHTE